MNREALQSILQQPFERARWLEMMRHVLPGTDIFATPQSIPVNSQTAQSVAQLGRVRLSGGRQLAVLEIEIGERIDLVRNRVGLRNLVARFIDQAEYQGVLAVFLSHESDFRFTFAARESAFDDAGNLVQSETAPRRYTYVLGPNESCRTAGERFSQLAAKAHDATLADVIEAFSVEKLNKEFFADFCRAFERVCADLQKHHRWPELLIKSEAQTLLNRLLFLYFVQRKGWLNRQRDYLVRNFREHFEKAPKGQTFIAEFLRPLFEHLSTEEPPILLPGHDLPFLNGGLFNDEYGEEQSEESRRRRSQLRLTNETCRYIFETLLEPYNFTIYEDSPTNYEVAIDPEMLGRIFEALVLQEEESGTGGKSLRHDTGSHYTPRPIVHYLSREALAGWLESQPPFSSPSPPSVEGEGRGEGAARKRIDGLLALDASEGIDDATRQTLDRLLTPEHAGILRDRLLELRSCDPAVGSGAFPMGLLHELLNLLRLCETRARGQDPVEGDRAWLYDTKKRVIERVLYGVDIQERAIEICRLRLWLSLMVDHDIGVDPFACDARSFRAHLRKLEPLPNLDFKIRRANSLRDTLHGVEIEAFREGKDVSGTGMALSINRLVEAKHEFYAARKAADKRRWRLDVYHHLFQIATHQMNQLVMEATGLILDEGDEQKVAKVYQCKQALKEIQAIQAQIAEARKSKARAAQQIDALERLQGYLDDEQRPTFVWELDFAEVFFRQPPSLVPNGGEGRGEGDSELALASQRSTVQRRGGFDLLIGNPPYVRIQTLKKQSPELADYFKRRYHSASKGNYDLYVCFVERGLELLEEKAGQLAYILPHKFFNAQYGEPLRQIISGRYESRVNVLRHAVHFGDQQIFPGATNYVCLLFLAKAGAKGGCAFVRADNLKQWLRTLKGTEGTIPANEIREVEWNFAVGRGADIFERLKAMPVKLEDVTERIFQGIKTSSDKIYIVEEVSRTRSEVRVFSPQTEEEHRLEPDLLHPLIKGGDSKAFRLSLTKRLILFPYAKREAGEVKLIEPATFKKQFPLTWAYLQTNKHVLEDREDGRMRHDGWYGYIYPKALDVMSFPKLFTPDLAPVAAFSCDPTGEVFFTGGVAGGYGIIPKPNVRPELLLALLNSRVLDFFHHKIASQMRGGWFSYESRFIRNLPIRALNLANAAERAQHDAIVQLVEWLLWLHRQPSVSESAREHPRDPLIAAYFEQWVNALVYELYFPQELHAAGLHFFDLTAEHSLPPVNEWREKDERLPKIRERLDTLNAAGHPLRRALDQLQTLDLVRIVEGGP
jgi:hypothetical protein